MTFGNRTIVSAFEHSVRRDPFAPAVIDPDAETRLDYQSLDRHARSFAGGLVRSGMQAGARVAIWAPNSWRWIASALGTWMAGGVVVPLNTRYRGHEAVEIVARTEPAVLVVDNGFLGNDYLAMLAEALQERPAAQNHVQSMEIVDLDAGAPAARAWESFVRGTVPTVTQEVERRVQRVSPQDVADIIFTSGTTGRPKGAMLAQGQIVETFDRWSEVVELGPRMRNLVVLPMSHAAGQFSGVVACLIRGATIVTQAVYSADQTLDLIRRERINVLNGPPTLLAELLDHPERGTDDLASLHTAITGSTTVPTTLVERLEAHVGSGRVLTAYGLTEACGTVTMCRRSDEPHTVASTSGTPIPDVSVRVVDGEGNQSPAGSPGEVWVRGFNIMVGYFDDAASSRRTVDADGWLHTGDVGVVDARGYLDIVGRMSDTFIVGGFNVYPAEVEQALCLHESVSEAAVIGVADARLGEVGRAYVVVRGGTITTEADLLAHCKKRLAGYKVPHSVVFVPELPRGSTGKVAKNLLTATT